MDPWLSVLVQIKIKKENHSVRTANVICEIVEMRQEEF